MNNFSTTEASVASEKTQRAKLIREIFGRAKEFHAGQGYDELKEMVHDDLVNWGISAERSISGLSRLQMCRLVIEYRHRLPKRPRVRRPRSKGMTSYEPVTPDQVRIMNELFEELGMDSQTRAQFCAHTISGYLVNRGEEGIALFWPQDRGQAQAVINGLISIKRRRGARNAESG